MNQSVTNFTGTLHSPKNTDPSFYLMNILIKKNVYLKESQVYSKLDEKRL